MLPGCYLLRPSRLSRTLGLIVAPVSHCCASHLSCLPKISNQQKGTPSCVDASHRYPARLRPKEDSRKLAALKHPPVYFSFGLHCSALRQGVGIQATTARQDIRVDFRLAALVCTSPRVKRREAQRRRVFEEQPRRPARLSAVKAARVLGACLQRKHRSEPSQPARTRVYFCWLTLFGISKTREVAR